MKQELSIFVASISMVNFLNTICGNINSNFIALLIIMLLDLITGLLCALVGKSSKTSSGKISSNAMFIGVVKKIVYIIIVIIAYQIDLLLNATYIRDSIIIIFICNDVLSIFENAALLGIPIPKFLIKILHEMEEKNNGCSG